MNWNRNSILIADSNEDFKNAIKEAADFYSKELKLLFENYNKLSSLNYGKHIRADVHKLEFEETDFKNNLSKFELNTENKDKVIDLLDERLDRIEFLDKAILEAHDLKNNQNADDKLDKTLKKISHLENQINDLSLRGAELNKELYLSFETKISLLIEKTEQSIKKGLNEISGFKSEIELGKNYREMIESQLKTSTNNVKVYFLYFVLSLLILITILLIPLFVDKWSSLQIQIGFRVALGLPLLWLTSFIFTHYKFFKVSQVKYQHIINLLGGGAYYIGELLDDKIAKEAANEKIIEMLLGYKDLSNLFYKEKEPFEKYVKKAIELLKESKDIYSTNTTHNT